ncbi:MAG: hypothetical protein DMG77_04360 [Acidobacteria bacterium]|nr:MAG: hypothetical protein DMG77_04360 [Acidobacteriota bacterium]
MSSAIGKGRYAASKLLQDPFDSMMNTCSRGLMSNGENQDRERYLRDRIATIVQAHEPARRKHPTNEEIQILRRAVGRLDQLIADAAADEEARCRRAKEEEAQALRIAAARLDQLLTDIATKETALELKLRHPRKK